MVDHSNKQQISQSTQPGLVVSYFGSMVAVETAAKEIIHCHLRRNQELPVVGDQVEWSLEKEQNTGVIEQICPRRSVLLRSAGHGKTKPIAANIDQLIIVMAPPPIFAEYLIDRYLAAAELLSISAALIVNKMDLVDPEIEIELTKRLAPYRAIPYPVLLTSLYAQQGLEKLAELLQHKTSVLVGPSGVGKSSIIAYFVEDHTIRIGDVSDKGSGKHTTTATRLYHVQGDGQLIDSPGVREFGLWPVTPADLLRAFKEFLPLLSQCKFRDCQHMMEPGCAIKSAVAAGQLSATRYENYQALMKTAKERK